MAIDHRLTDDRCRARQPLMAHQPLESGYPQGYPWHPRAVEALLLEEEGLGGVKEQGCVNLEEEE